MTVLTERMQTLAKKFLALEPEARKTLRLKVIEQGLSLEALPIPRREDTSAPTAASYAQQRLWFLWQLDRNSTAYNQLAVLRLRGALNVSHLQRSIQLLIDRHEVLRTNFSLHNDQVMQIVHSQRAFEIETINDTGVENNEAFGNSGNIEQRLADEINKWAGLAFDLENDLLLRTALVKLSESEHVLLFCTHHIVCDGWSLPILIDEITAAYTSLAAGQHAPEFTALPIQYADYALWQRAWMEAGERERQLSYWTAQLGGEQPVLELPQDHARPAVRDQRGARIDLRLDIALSQSLQQLAQREGVTLFTLLLASFQTLLHRYSGQTDIRVGIPIANRNRQETERLIGFFVNTQVIKAQVDSHMRFRDLLQQLKQTLVDAQAHQDLPFEQLVEALQPERTINYSPLFQVMYTHKDREEKETARKLFSGLEITALSSAASIATQSTQFDLSLETVDTGSGIGVSLTYALDLFEAATVQRMAAHWQRLLESIAADSGQRVSELSLLDAVESEQQIALWNKTGVLYADTRCVHRVIETQVERSPQAIAAIFGERRLTYAQLNNRANQLAHRLIELGVGPDICVGVSIERSLEMVIGLLAILKAGGAYVPLDPTYPSERLAYMFDDSGIQLLLTTSDLQTELPIASDIRILCLDREDAYADAVNNPAVELHAENLAYLIYTSGSTGKPKGAGNRHVALSNRLWWMQHAYTLHASDSVLQKTPFSFDVSVWEFFWPLMFGARLVIAAPEIHRDPAQLIAAIKYHAVTTLHFVPSMLQAFLHDSTAAQCHTLARVICSGEALSESLQRQLFEKLPHVSLYNLYGPTEAAIDVTHWTCGNDNKVVPIGRPIANLYTHILDAALGILPVRARGELYLGGVGLARGYHRRAALTAERFIPDPFGGDGGRLYRTGDAARYRSNGVIDYDGRLDNQVKIRGLRIELGEIEAQLQQLSTVRETAVVVHNAENGKILVGYIVPADFAAVTVTDRARSEFCEMICAQLAASLPDHMIPRTLVPLESLPLSPNGKLDRKALPKPTLDNDADSDAPQGDIEETLAKIWAEVLGVSNIGRQDSFFSLGGHSLLAIRLLERIRRAGWSADLNLLFRFPRLSEFASRLVSNNGNAIEIPPNKIPFDSAAIEPSMLTLIALDAPKIRSIETAIPGGARNIQDIYPLAPLQEGILFHHLLQSEGDPYINSNVIAFDSRERLQQFVENMNEVIARHDILRTAVLWEGLPEPVQVVQRRADFKLLWLENVSGDPLEHLKQYCDQKNYRLDVRRAPLIGAIAAADPAKQRWLLALATHHLILDHTTLDLLIQEIALIQQSRQTELPEPVAFREFVARSRLGVTPADHEAFFKQRLGDITEPTLPFNLLNVRGDGSAIVETRVSLTQELNLAIRRQAQRYGVSAATLFHLAWAIVLAKTTGRENVVFGTVLFGRMQGGEGAERALGMFINTLPLRLRLGDRSLFECVQQTHDELMNLIQHEHASLSLALRCSGLTSGTPLFSSVFNYRYIASHAEADETLAAWRGMELVGGEERTNYPFSMSVDDKGDAFTLVAQIDATVNGGTICRYFENSLQQLIKALSENTRKIYARDIEIADIGEREQIKKWSVNETGYGECEFVHKLFERQAQQQPHATALVFDGRFLNYAELNERSNRLAHYLRSQGVDADVRVGIALERSFEMVVGLLGILKAGGAYVPLDPDYPADRLNYMIADSGVTLLLTRNNICERLAPVFSLSSISVLNLDALNLNSQPTSNPALSLHPENAAYVIYTSGSTGKPKGVTNRHLSLFNRLTWMQDAYRLDDADTVLQKTPFSFDVSVWEFFWPLMQGARLVLANPGDHREPTRLVELITREKITTLHFVPSMLQAFLTAAIEACTSIRRVICSGEALPAEVQNEICSRLPQAELYNLYGPTEAAIDVTHWTCRNKWTGRKDSSLKPVPIGQPISATQCHVLDNDLTPTPQGVAGELYLGGIGLARGYLNKPALSAERFVANPFDAGSRLYRTGDLVRWNHEGQLEYLGRLDHQVKIRGLRIELGEIEARLLTFPDIREAVVVARGNASDARLVAYVSAMACATPNSRELNCRLAEVLPDYMVPTSIEVLETLPLNANGKVDRAALPDPMNSLQQMYVAPRNDLEQKVAQVWQEILGVERIGITDNFFEMGGHSLTAIQVISRLTPSSSHPIKLRDLFDHPVLENFVTAIEYNEDKSVAKKPALQRSQNKSVVPLSLMQRRIWIAEQLTDAGSAYAMPMALRLRGPISVQRLLESIAALVKRHEVLRTHYAQDDAGDPIAIVADDMELICPIVDISELSTAQKEARVAAAALENVYTAIALDQAPLFRASLLRLNAEEHVLFYSMHHIISDAWSMSILMNDLVDIYARSASGAAHELPPLPLQYSDFALWQQTLEQEGHLQRQMQYWQTELAGYSGYLPLATDKPRQPSISYAGGSFHFQIPQLLLTALKTFSSRTGVTLYATLLASFQMQLHQMSLTKDVVVGIDVAGRQHSDLEKVVGFFVNVLPLRSRVTRELTVAEFMKASAEKLLTALENQDLPFDMIVDAVGTQRQPGVNPLVQILFVMTKLPLRGAVMRDISVEAVPAPETYSKFDMALFLDEEGEQLQGNWQFSTELFQQERIEKLCDQWMALLEKVVANPDSSLGHILDSVFTEPVSSAAVSSASAKLAKFLNRPATQRKKLFDAPLRESQLVAGQSLPLLLQPADAGVDIVEWIKNNRASIDAKLVQHGGILFRDFNLEGIKDFEAFAEAVQPGLYGKYGDLPKKEGGKNIYRSTPYPEERMILFHNESSHQHRWPRKQMFYCEQPALAGGATPIVDCRAMYEQLPHAIRHRFEEGLLYVRNFVAGFDVSWQHFFGTEDRRDVELQCSSGGIEWNWFEDNRLQTRTRCPAVIRHPESGALSFFNQVQLHHPYFLDEETRRDLESMLGADWMPRNVYYGDGSVIEDEIMHLVGELYAQCAVRFEWKKGDVILLDNMLVAHARDPYRGPRKIVVAMGDMMDRSTVIDLSSDANQLEPTISARESEV